MGLGSRTSGRSRGALLGAVVAVALVAGCGPRVASLDPLPDMPSAEVPVRDGRPFLEIREGRLGALHDSVVTLAPGTVEFVVRTAPEGLPPRQGEEPLAAALWLRGRGARRHLLPESTSPLVNPDNTDDWVVTLQPGIYDLTVQLVGMEFPRSGAVVVVR